MTQEQQPSIQLHQLTKQFADQVIFQQINYTWQGTGIFVLSGANGAGKSTLLQMIVGMESLTSGQIYINGQVLQQERVAQQLAFVPDTMVAYPFITGREFLAFIASLRQVPMIKALELVDLFTIQTFLDIRFDAMSFGTAKKFMLISAFMSNTSILIFDEPTHGLDSKSLQVFQQLLSQAVQNKLILMTCHDLHLQQQLQMKHVDMQDLIGEAA